MRVLCLSRECELLRQVGAVFADRIVEMNCGAGAEQFLNAAGSGVWDVLFIDFDTLYSAFPNPVEFVKRLGLNSRVLMVGSSSFANWHHELQLHGALVLHKPTTIGEIGLALRKLAAGQTRRLAG